MDGSGWEVFARISVNVGVLQGSFVGPTLFLLYINDLPGDAICNIAIYADDTTLYSKFDYLLSVSLCFYLSISLSNYLCLFLRLKHNVSAL